MKIIGTCSEKIYYVVLKSIQSNKDDIVVYVQQLLLDDDNRLQPGPTLHVRLPG